MDSLLYGLLWWVAISAVAALMWLTASSPNERAVKRRQQR